MVAIAPSSPYREVPMVSAAWTLGNFGTDPKLNPHAIGNFTNAALTTLFFQAVTAAEESTQRQMQQDRDHHVEVSRERKRIADKPKAKATATTKQTEHQAARLVQKQRMAPNHIPTASFQSDTLDPRAVMDHIHYVLITGVPV